MAITAKSIFNAIIEKVGSTYGKHVIYYVAGPHGDKSAAMERLDEVAKTLSYKFSVKDVVFLGSNTKGAFDNKFKVDTATWKIASKGKEIEYNDYNVLLATPKLGLYLVEFGNDNVFGKCKLLFKDSEFEQSGDKLESRNSLKAGSKTRAGRILESLRKRRKFNESSSKYLDWYNKFLEDGDGIEFEEMTVREFKAELKDFVEDSETQSDFDKACKDAGMTSNSEVSLFVEEDAMKAVELLKKSNHKVKKFGEWWVYHVEKDADPDEGLTPVMIYEDKEEMMAWSFI